MTDRYDYGSATDIAAMLGVTRQQVHRLAGRPDFPRPAAVVSGGRVWRQEDVREWASAKRRPVGRPRSL